MYALWQAYENYNPTKGKLTTYLNYQIKFKLIDLIRKKEGQRLAEETLIKDTATLLHSGNYNRQKNQMLVSFEDLPVRDHSLWLKIRSLLTLKQWKWIYYFIICDMSLREIARLENVTIEAVKGWAKEARKKLRHDDTLKAHLIDTIMM